MRPRFLGLGASAAVAQEAAPITDAASWVVPLPRRTDALIRSMGRQPRNLIVRSFRWFGPGLILSTRLIPNDWLGLECQGMVQHLVHKRHRDDFERILDGIRNFDEVLGILLRY